MATQLGKASEQVKFLHGTQAALDQMMSPSATETIKAKIEAGAFYFTTDSHRMYLAQADKTIVPVNDSIIKVNSINDLPVTDSFVNDNISSFYYSISENVMCIAVEKKQTNGSSYNPKQWKWIQVNPDTHVIESTLATDGVGIKHSLKISGQANTLDTHWGFDTTNSNVTITLADSTVGGITKKLFTIKCEATFGVNTQSTYGEIEFSNGSSDDAQIVKFTTPDGSKLKISSSATTGSVIFDDSALQTADVTGITQTIGATDATDNGRIYTTINRGTNTTIADSFLPKIAYGKASDDATTPTISDAKFKRDTGKDDEGTLTLDVYTTGEVKDLILQAKQTMDAMTFKAVLTNTALPNTSVQIGDTYKIGIDNHYTITGKYYQNSTDNNSGEEWAKVGDLFIATIVSGKEEVNGYINSSDIKWEYVPSGDENYNIYTATLNDYGFKITENTNNDILKFDLKQGTGISLSKNSNTVAKNGREVTINHATITTTNNSVSNSDQTEANATGANNALTKESTLNYITDLTINNGHVTSVNTSSMKLVDTNATVKEHTISATADTSNNSVAITSGVSLAHVGITTEDKKTAKFTLQSDNANLQISAATQTEADNSTTSVIKFNFVWDTFGD